MRASADAHRVVDHVSPNVLAEIGVVLMYFENWSAVWHMEGHGPYVWAAYSVTALVILFLVVSPWLRGRQLTRDIRHDEQRLAAVSTASGEPHAPET